MSMSRAGQLLLLGLVAASCVFAQSTTSAASAAPSSTVPTSASSDSAITHTVSVAYAGFTFQPDVVQAAVGDVVEFDFYPQNHSVVRAEYKYPCIPYELTGVDKVGFFSGFEPVDAILPDPPKWSIRVNDSDPIFYYCSAPGSCIGYGMVGVINPNSSVSLSVQKQLAENSTFMLEPGQDWPSEENPFSSSSSSIPTATASNSVSPASASATSTTATAASSGSHHSGLSGGAIAGIAIGAAAVALMAAALVYLCGRNKALSDYIGGGRRRNNMDRGSYMPSEAGHMGSAPPMTGPKYLSGTTVSAQEQPHSGMSSLYGHPSPALPGYMPMSPPPHHSYAPTEGTMSPQTMDMPRSPSPGQMGAPAYTAHPPPTVEQRMEHGHGPHEMDAPMEESGLRNFFRRSGSTKKAGTAERYG